MKTIKRLLTALLASLLALSLTACNKNNGGEVNIPANQTGSDDFQKNMHQSQGGDLDGICETREGCYFNCDLGPGLKFRLYYMDKATKKVTVLCGKPDCDHTEDTCNALVDALGIWTDGSRLYYVRAETGGEKRVYSEALDGTQRREVMSLGQAAYDRPICHRGEVYFVSKGAVYAVKLGGDIEGARRIWGQDNASEAPDGGYAAYDPDEPHYTLWADGDTLYFMVNVTGEDGARKDTLFSYPLSGGEAEQVWETPDKEDVGEWESTGVSVSQWYVADGAVYFYLSGGDFWRSDLATGETVKLADTSDKTLYGTAVFSDEYMCLLNDHPMTNPFDGTLMVGAPFHEGGDTVFVYDLEGTLLKELSLKPLTEKLGNINGFTLLFCDGETLYFNADAGHMSEEINGVSQRVQNNVLCHLNIDTGEIQQLYNWQ